MMLTMMSTTQLINTFHSITFVPRVYSARNSVVSSLVSQLSHNCSIPIFCEHFAEVVLELC